MAGLRHPGWSGWFTWGGRRGRLSYLGASILFGLAFGALATACAFFAGIGAEQSWTALSIAGVGGIVLAALAGALAFFCTMAQRMRDIGMPVVPCLAAYVVGSLAASAGVALQGASETAAPWNPDYPLWLNLLQLALVIFALAVLLVPGNAWLDED